MSSPAPLRLAFVGQQTFFRACVMNRPAFGIDPTFIEHRSGSDAGRLRARLDALAPDAVVVFRPETLPRGLLADFPAPVLGFLTEPISRAAGSGAAMHWDLEDRRRQMRQLDPANVDRLVSFDPLIVPTVEAVMPVWRSLAIPVADELFGPVRERWGVPPRMLFVGRSTLHRERFLIDIKHRFDCLHVAFGIQAPELARLLESHEVTFNIHNEEYLSFENRVLLHLAAGHLVISEPLSPDHGLVATRDYLEAATPEAMLAAAVHVDSDITAFRTIRENGRRQAERFRASAVWPDLVRELVADVAERGTHRAKSRVAAASASV